MKVLLVHPGADWSTADYWRGYERALRRAGVDIVDYALNNRLVAASGWLRYCWRRNGRRSENKPTYADNVYQASVGTIERALRFAVDWVIIVSGMFLHPDVVIMLRRAGVRVATLFTECPYQDAEQMRFAQHCNVAFVNERTSVEAFRGVCAQTHYLAHAYDPDVHRPAIERDNTPGHDVTFVGTGFRERVDLLKEVDWGDIDLGLYGSWELLGPRNRLRRYVRAGVTPNHDAVRLYRRSKVNLNMHRRADGAQSVNPRVLELAACGAFFVTDWRDEMADLGLTGVPLFTDATSLQDRVRHWLAAPSEERQWNAEVARRAVEGQTFDARVRQVLSVLS